MIAYVRSNYTPITNELFLSAEQNVHGFVNDQSWKNRILETSKAIREIGARQRDLDY